MSLTLTNADAALKEDYQPAMREQLNNTVQFLAQIERNSKDVEGRRAVLSLHVKRNSGVGARQDGGSLPSAGAQGYAEERVPLRFNYGRIQISGPTLRAMKSDEGSFVRALDSETKGVVTDLRRDVNRQLFGTSDGVIAATDVTAGSTTVVLSLTITSADKRYRKWTGVDHNFTAPSFNTSVVVRGSADTTTGNAANYVVVEVFYTIITDGP